MSTTTKTEISASNFEVDSHHAGMTMKALHLTHGSRVALTMLALLMGIVILGVSGNSLAVYNRTHVPTDFLLPLWPSSFDVRPTNALVGGSVVVIIANIMSLATSKISSLRSRAMVHSSASLAAPTIGLIASIVTIALFYAVNASTEVDTFTSWTCRWKDVSMVTEPHFGSLCQQSWAATILSVILVPLEAVILALAGTQVALEKRAQGFSATRRQKAGSPALS